MWRFQKIQTIDEQHCTHVAVVDGEESRLAPNHYPMASIQNSRIAVLRDLDYRLIGGRMALREATVQHITNIPISQTLIAVLNDR